MAPPGPPSLLQEPAFVAPAAARPEGGAPIAGPGKGREGDRGGDPAAWQGATAPSPPPSPLPPSSSSPAASLFDRWEPVGRQREAGVLWEAYRRASAGPPSTDAIGPEGAAVRSSSGGGPTSRHPCDFMLVRGGPGTGKTSLIAQQTLGRWTTDDGNGGYFCSGAFDARRSRPEPYSAFVSAVSSLAAQALARGEQEAARIRRALTDAMGRDAARSLVEMVPSVGALMEDEQSLVSSHGACVGSTGTAAAGTSSSGDAEDASFALSAGVAVGDGGCGDLSRHLGPGGNPSGGAAAAASRFKKAVRMFLRAATAPDRPLVLLLDDLQWADEASLDLLQWLVFDGDNSSSTANSGTQQVGGFLIVGTLQADAVHGDTDRGNGEDREVRMLLQLQQEDRANVTVLDLENLTRAEVERLLAAHLRTSLDSCEHEGGDDDGTLSSPRPIQGLASLLLESTRGNPLLLRETLVHLRDSGLFSRRSGGSSWEWDLEEIRVEIAAALPRGAMFQRKIQSLPPSAREMLQTASCLGGGAVLNDDTLRRVSPRESLASDVQAAARCGLLCWIPTSSGGGYAFAHDGAKQAIYQLIARGERGALHSKIGRRLWASLELGEVERYMFDVIGQFMLGDGRYESLRERKEIALLYLRASLRALTVSSYDSAQEFLSRGIACLGDQRWRESYTLTLSICNVSAEVAYCQGDFSMVECLAEEVIKHARVIDDTFRSQLTRIYALGGGNRMQDAIGIGFDLLKTLGIVALPANPTWVHTWWHLTSLRRLLKKKYSFESIMRLPDMKNARALVTAQVLNLILLYATTVRYELAPLIGVLLVRLTLEHGLCPVSCLGFVSYAMALCGYAGDVDAGFAYGQLGLRMFDKFPAQTWLVRLTCGYYGCVHEWKRPTRETLAPLKRAHEIGLESGDIEFSIFCMNVYLWKQFGVLPLPELEREIRETVTLMDLHGQLSNRTMIASVWQGALNLMGRASGDVCALSGDAMDERDLLRWKGAKEGVFVWACHIKMVLCYLFGRYDEASECAEHCQELIRHPFGTPGVCAVVFFESLTYLALERSSPKRSRMKVIKRGLRKMKNWAHHSPNNFLAMQCLLEAELAAVKGAEGSARAKYLCAISLSKDMGALQLIAMSYERLGKFLQEGGHQADALQHFDDALQYYEAYGAVAKAQHLRSQMIEPRWSRSSFFKPT